MSLLQNALVTLCAVGLSAPSFAQPHAMQNMPGMATAAAPKKAKPRRTIKPVTSPVPAPVPPASTTPADHTMDHGAMPDMQMPMPSTTPAKAEGELAGTSLPAGSAPAPPRPGDHFADQQFPKADMARARDAMMKDSGGQTFGLALLNIAEYQFHRGRDGYRWDGEAFYGGDINRFWMKSEGEGELSRGLDSGDVQLLYSRAVDPFFNLQAGVRQDIGPGPRRTYATLGVEGLAPGMFEVEAAMFLSTKGELLGRVEGYYDQRVTQRLILQPRVEVNLSGQDITENAVGAGVTNVELGVRLRYEFARQFAPYVGVSYSRKFGNTARLARAAGEDVHATSLVAGIRFWF